MALVGMVAWILSQLIGLFIFVLLVWIIMGWLINFGVITYRNPLVGNVMGFCEAVVTPVLAPIRQFIPPLGGIDISPILLVIGLRAIQMYVLWPLQ